MSCCKCTLSSTLSVEELSNAQDIEYVKIADLTSIAGIVLKGAIIVLSDVEIDVDVFHLNAVKSTGESFLSIQSSGSCNPEDNDPASQVKVWELPHRSFAGLWGS